MSDKSQLPKRSDFAPEAEFVIQEFDVPLVRFLDVELEVTTYFLA